MVGPVSLATVFPGLVWAMAVLVLVQVVRRAALSRAGATAPVAWLDGLAKLPRRYLVAVHHVVARDAYASRIHAVVAGGPLAASILTALAILPPLGGSAPYWILVALAFGVPAAESLLVVARRYPRRTPRLSSKRFQILPVLLVAHPRPGRFEGQPDTALQPLDLEAPRLGAAMPADFTWNRLVSYDACVSCGRCETACPAVAAGQPLKPEAAHSRSRRGPVGG